MADKRTRWIIEATSNIPDINKQLEQLISLQRTQNELTQQNTTSTALAIQRQREQVEQLVAAQSKSTAGGRQQVDLMGALRKEYDLLSKQLAGLAQLAAGAWAVGQLKTYAQEVIQAKSANDGFVASMEQMLGSRLKAEELNAKLINIALKSPFQIDQLQEVTKKLQGMGVETEKLIPYINMLGDISAIVGSQKLPLIAKALTDVQSKHTLMAQEIKQFTDNGVPLYDLLAKSMNKPVEEIRKLASEHKLTFNEVEKALMDATQKGGIYYNQMGTQAKQLGGMVSNLGDLYTQAKARIGDFFEYGIRSGIKTTGEFIQATIGSENAINRTLTALKAALAAWISYRTAVLSVDAAKRANNVTTLAGLASIEASTVATVGLTGVTGSLSGALNGLKVAFMSNPFGFVATAVTSLISLFYTFKSATIEVSEAQSLEAENLRKTNQEVANAITRVKGLTVGTEERKKATQELIAKYPELFKHLDAESLGNAQLETVLKRVNAQYREKIQLAILDAKNNTLLEKQIDLETQRYEIVKKLREQNAAISIKFADDNQFLAELDKVLKTVQTRIQQVSMTGTTIGGGNSTDGGVFQQMIMNAKTLEREIKEVQGNITKNANEQSSIRVKIDASEQNQKIVELRRQLRNNEITIDEFNKKVEALGKDTASKQAKTVEEGEDKKRKSKKTTTELALENDLEELKSTEQTYMNKLKMLDAEENLAKERAKRQIDDSKALHDRLASITIQYAAKREGIMRKEIESRIDYEMKDLKEAEKAAQKYIEIKEKEAQQIEDLTNHIYGIQEKERQEDLERSMKASQDLITVAKKFQAEIIQNGAIDAAEHKKWWQTKEQAVTEYWLKVKAEEIRGYEEERQRLAAHMEKMLELFGGDSYQYKEGLAAYLMNEEDLAKAEQDYEGFLNRTEQSSMNWAASIIDMFSQAFEGVKNSIMKAGEQVDESFGKVIDIYEDLKEANKKAMETILKDTTLTYDQMVEKLRESARTQSEIIRAQNDLEWLRDQNKAYMVDLENGFQEVNKGFGAITSALNGDIGSTITNLVGMFSQMVTTSNESLGMMEQNRAQHQYRMAQAQAQAAELEIQLATDLLNQKFALWDAELAKFIEIKNQEMEKANEVAAAQKAREEQASSDQQLRLLNDSNYRAQLLADGEAREVAALEAAKQREIQRAQERGASAQEVADIVNAFEALIAEKHKEYSDAKGNKDAEISLATKERKAQETQYVNKLEEDLKNEIKLLKDEILAKEQENSANKQAAQKEYADYVKALQGMQFEAEKQMAIAQIRVEIALLKSKKNIFNKGKINEAIGDLEAAMNEISGVGNPYGYENPSRGSGSGTIITHPNEPPRNPSDPGGGRPGAGGDGTNTGGGIVIPGGSGNGPINPGGGDDDGRTGGPRGSRPLFHGDTWVTRAKWDSSALYGIDEIRARIHEGERVMPTYLNQLLGAKVTNQELVHGYLQYANFMDRLPDTSIPNAPAMVLPEFNIGGPQHISMDRLEKKLDDLNQTFKTKSMVNINVDQNGVGISEYRNQQKINYYNTLFKD